MKEDNKNGIGVKNITIKRSDPKKLKCKKCLHEFKHKSNLFSHKKYVKALMMIIKHFQKKK